MSVFQKNSLKFGVLWTGLCLLLTVIGCAGANKDIPEPLLTENQMIDILYDLTIVDGIRMNNPSFLIENKVSTSKYIFEKHQIDSLTFAENNKYYAGKFDAYLRIYDSIYKRLDHEKTLADSLAKGLKNPPKNIDIQIDTIAIKKKGLSKIKAVVRD